MGAKIHRLDKCLEKLEKIKGLDMSKPLSKGALHIVRRARDLVPIDTSQLQNSIWYEPRDGSFFKGVTIFAGAEYAVYVEFGTRGPRFVPIKTLKGEYTGIDTWARKRLGIDISKRGGMMVSGKPQPFLYPAYRQEIKNAEKTIVKLTKEELSKISKLK